MPVTTFGPSPSICVSICWIAGPLSPMSRPFSMRHAYGASSTELPSPREQRVDVGLAHRDHVVALGASAAGGGVRAGRSSGAWRSASAA